MLFANFLTHRFNNVLCAVFFLFFLLEFNSVGYSATYYVAPNGNDSNLKTSGTSAAPWKTFRFALPKLLPGDTLMLVNGTYGESTSGYINLQCGKHAKNGTDSQPITVKAEHERQAFLKGTGNKSEIFIRNCAFWIFEGLRIEGEDFPKGSSQGQVIYALNSHHLTFRRLLLQKNNRYQNSELLLLDHTHDCLIEENEFYSFHRHALNFSYGDNNQVRRNYFNSRNHHDIAGGYPSDPKNRGDAGIAIYPGSHNILENNIIENTGQTVEINAASTTVNNKFFGNIALNNNYGIINRARGNSLKLMPRDTYLENHVTLNSTLYGAYFRATKNTKCKNCTSLDSGKGGYVSDKPSSEGDGSPTVYFENVLAVNNGTYGFLLQGHADFGIDSSISSGQADNFSPSISSSYLKTSSLKPGVNPGLGSCKVFIPDNSPLKGAGKNGEDIGANVLYRYENEALTRDPLWNPGSGEFLCGVKVNGVNDVPGFSCFDVHKRLNVNFNGCSLPENYGKDAQLR